MNTTELKNYLLKSDIFLGEWLSTDTTKILHEIIQNNPGITNKSIFLTVESPLSSPSIISTSLSLIKENRINNIKILENFTDNQILEYYTSTQRGTDYNLVHTYLNNGTGSLFPALLNQAILYKDANDIENYMNQIKWSLNQIGHNITFNQPNFTGKQSSGIYREKWYSTLDEYKKDHFNTSRKSTIGIIESTMYVEAQQLQPYYALIEELEKKGFNVIPIVAYGATPEQLTSMIQYFTNATNATDFLKNPQNYHSNIDLLFALPAYGLGGEYFSLTTDFFEDLNVPVIRTIHSDYLTNEQWELSPTGLPSSTSERWWHVTIAEAQGIIEATFVGGKTNIISNYTGAQLTGYQAHLINIEKLVERAKSWVDLKYTSNSNKTLSLIYYNYPVGKSNIGSSYLNTISSLYNVLNILKNEGYDVGNTPTTEKELEDLLIKYGLNVANWSRGDLETMADSSNVVLLSVDEYNLWFNNLENITKIQIIEGPVAYIGELSKRAVTLQYTETISDLIDDWYSGVIALLPDNKYNQAMTILGGVKESLKSYTESGNISDYNRYLDYKNQWKALNISGMNGWGEAPGDVMTVTRNGTKYFVIPGIKFGNIFVSPEPPRGWEDNTNALYHSTAVAPTHQYLAAFYYFQEYYSSAMVFMGRHGTHEWLPGKEVVLSSTDYPSIVTGSTPQIYYYISDGLAEGIQAKRRGFATMISHLTPAMTFTQLYGGSAILLNQLDQYEDSQDETTRSQIITKIKNTIREYNLAKSIGIDSLETISDARLIPLVDAYISDLQDTLYPYGLHTIGENWTDREVALLVVSMLSVDFEYDGHLTNIFDEVSNKLYNKSYNDISATQKETVQNSSIDIVMALIYSEPDTVYNILGYNSEGLNQTLILGKKYIQAVSMSITNEVSSLLNALNGGFVKPGAGGDPISNPSILPTGVNFFQDQSAELPTKKAYEYGRVLTLLTLSNLTDDTEKIAMGIWCVETARDDGALVSTVLYLLGMSPEWSSSPSAGEDGAKVRIMPKYIELEDLVRPDGWEKKRIDVTVITSGLFRDLYSTQATILDNAFRVSLARSYNTIMNNASLRNYFLKDGEDRLKQALDPIMEDISWYGVGSESLDDNYIAKHWVEDLAYYISQNMTSEYAGEAAITKIFAPPNGDYGAGVSQLVSMSWVVPNSSDLAEFYINRMGNMYTKNNWGLSDSTVFTRALNNTGTIIVSRNTNLYGVLDNDDFFDYWGGLSLAIESITGSIPDMNVLYYANTQNPSSSSLEKFLNRELVSRYYNPDWIKGVMGEGYSGARYISDKLLHNMLGWSATRTGTIDNWMWDEVNNIYLKDSYNMGTTKWLKSGNNVYAYTHIQDHLITAAYKKYWNTDTSTMKELVNNWANSIIKNGASGSSATGNTKMIEWAMQYMDSSTKIAFQEAMYKSTQNPVYKTNTSTSTSTNTKDTGKKGSTPIGESSPTDIGGEASSASAQSTSGEAGEGKAYELTMDSNQATNMSAATVELISLVAAILLILFLILGYWDGKNKLKTYDNKKKETHSFSLFRSK